MATTKFQALVLLVTCPVVTEGVSAAGGGPKAAPVPGGWSPIPNPNDLKVQSLGEFAATEHNMQARMKLAFEKVVRGWNQVAAGVNYKLIIAAKDGAISNNYEAVVYVRCWEHTWSLTSFTPLVKA